jgi:predicted NAD/FAD-binding protein
LEDVPFDYCTLCIDLHTVTSQVSFPVNIEYIKENRKTMKTMEKHIASDWSKANSESQIELRQVYHHPTQPRPEVVATLELSELQQLQLLVEIEPEDKF